MIRSRQTVATVLAISLGLMDLVMWDEDGVSCCAFGDNAVITSS